jgi:adenine phosphoribosyltransferase
LQRLDSNQIIYEHENTPFILSSHHIHLVLPRSHLKKENVLQLSEHKNVQFYHIHDIVNNVSLNDWIVNDVCMKISQFTSQHNFKFDGIISAEARGWLFAAPIAHNMGLPLYVARKSGKLPGNVIRKTYQKEGYTADGKESIELPINVKAMSLVMIDDGIASGITTSALYDLVTSNDNYIPLIIPIINHTYANCKFKTKETKIITLFDL